LAWGGYAAFALSSSTTFDYNSSVALGGVHAQKRITSPPIRNGRVEAAKGNAILSHTAEHPHNTPETDAGSINGLTDLVKR